MITPRVTLESISDKIDYGLTASATNFNTGIKFLRITDIQYDHVNWEDVPYCKCTREEATQYHLREGDILFARTGATTGKSFLIRRIPQNAVFASYLIRVRPKFDVMYPLYLSYFFHTSQYWQQIAGSAVGAAQLGVNSTKLGHLIIPLPPLPEQKRIAAILEKADRLRRLRRYALELSGTYLQGIFLEMFGDPVTNPKGWEIRPLKSIALKFSDGPFGSNLKTEHYADSGIRIIRLQNIGVGQLIDDDKVYISEAHFATLDKHRCIPGDIVVGTLGDPNLRACILPSYVPLAVNKADCVQIRVNPKEAIAEYICWLINLPQTLFLATGMIHGQTRARINMGRLAELEVPIPHPTQQQEFVQIVRKYEKLQIQQREALRQAEHLFQTLLHKAFQGELSLDEGETVLPDVEMVDRQTPGIADVAGPVDTDAYQLALPLE